MTVYWLENRAKDGQKNFLCLNNVQTALTATLSTIQNSLTRNKEIQAFS
jgi:hypothetical protein